jgi:hypothetical protein
MLAHYYKEFQSFKDGKTDVWLEEFCEGSPAEKKSNGIHPDRDILQ